MEYILSIILAEVVIILAAYMFLPIKLFPGRTSTGVISEIQCTSFYNILHVFTMSEHDFYIVSPSRYEHKVGDQVVVLYNRYTACIYGEKL